jgi:hypothetical protein
MARSTATPWSVFSRVGHWKLHHKYHQQVPPTGIIHVQTGSTYPLRRPRRPAPTGLNCGCPLCETRTPVQCWTSPMIFFRCRAFFFFVLPPPAHRSALFSPATTPSLPSLWLSTHLRCWFLSLGPIHPRPIFVPCSSPNVGAAVERPRFLSCRWSVHLFSSRWSGPRSTRARLPWVYFPEKQSEESVKA